MAKYPDDDLFAGSTMSFGEHLEELRASLFKALIGVVLGFLVGLLVAKHVVEWIQMPLRDALEQHYMERAQTELHGTYQEKLPPAIEDFIRGNRVVFEEIYIERQELDRWVAEVEEGMQEAGTQEEDRPVAGTRQAAAIERRAGKAASTTALRPSPSATADPSASDEVSEQLQQQWSYELATPNPDLIKTRIWRPVETKIQTLNVQEAFMIWLKAGFFAGILIASPWIFWQLWLFVGAGLYPHEKRYVYLFLPMSLGLFWGGAALAFFFVFKYVLKFLFGFNAMLDIHTEPRISEWLSFCLMLPVGFGIAFQLPLVMLLLERIGIFSVQAYLDKWRVAILVIFVIAMLLTPADPISMLSMALPLTGLYFLGIALCRWLPRSRSPYTEVYEP